jgi:hypothetical protein
MNQHRTLFAIMTLLIMLFALAACGMRDDNAQGMTGVPPTPQGGTPVFESTPGIGDPVVAPQTVGTPSADQGAGIGGAWQHGDDSGGAGQARLSNEQLGVQIPLPEGSQPLDEAATGARAEADDGSTVYYYSTRMRGDEVVAHFEQALAGAGYQMTPVVAGEGQNTLLSFQGNGHSGLIAIVSEGTDVETLFTITMNPAQR